jgi:hypothetical protein
LFYCSGVCDCLITATVNELQEAENNYVKTMQEKALSLKLPEGLIPTNEEMQSLVEDVTALERVEGLRKRAYMFLEEKAETSSQAHHCVDSIVKRLDEDLIKLETQLKATGTFETSGGKPNDLAAIQVTPSVNEWILAKVISFNAGSGMYNLSDEDVESNKVFHLPESQVVVLNGVDRLSRGEIVYAVYPDTTSFYQATVVQPPRKVQGSLPFIMVNFVDDSDEHGITHDKPVMIKHVMRPPV